MVVLPATLALRSLCRPSSMVESQGSLEVQGDVLMPRELTEHEKAITLHGRPDGEGGNFYWATCSYHGSDVHPICPETRDITERTYAVKFHLRGLM